MYEIKPSDTFDLISRREYGSEDQAQNIADANPGAIEPLIPGTTLIIPPAESQDILHQTASESVSEVAVLIDGKRFRFWQSVRISRSIDAMDMVDLSAPFDSEAFEFKETFIPFTYKKIEITVGGIPLFTGTIIAPPAIVENRRKIVVVSAYSLPGVLNDCTANMNAKLEFDEQGLQNIAASLAKPFGISVEFAADEGAIFERVRLQPERKIFSFLADLAHQRNVIISSTTLGRLLFWQSVQPGNPVAILKQGFAPLLSVVPFFNGQEYYSHIIGREPVTIGFDGGQFAIKNPHLTDVFRPLSFEVPDTQSADVKKAVEAKMGRMFGNAIAYSIRVATWRDPDGNLWTPNTTIILLAPDAMIYKEYEFIIRSIEFERERAAETAVINLVLPGAFDGKIPETLPWQE